MNFFKLIILSSFLFFINQSIIAGELDTKISIKEKGAVTYYVSGQVRGYDRTDFMIDTGSGYSAINETMLQALRIEENIEYLETISAIMANGKQTSLPVYRIGSINIGGKCAIENLEVVILPGDTRNILGLNALKKAAPFAMSMNPPKLILSNCQVST